MRKSDISEFPGMDELSLSSNSENNYFRELATYAENIIAAAQNGGTVSVTGGLLTIDLSTIAPGLSFSISIPTAISGGTQKIVMTISPQTTVNWPDPDTGPNTWQATNIFYMDNGVDPAYWDVTITA